MHIFREKKIQARHVNSQTSSSNRLTDLIRPVNTIFPLPFSTKAVLSEGKKGQEKREKIGQRPIIFSQSEANTKKSNCLQQRFPLFSKCQLLPALFVRFFHFFFATGCGAERARGTKALKTREAAAAAAARDPSTIDRCTRTKKTRN